MIYFRIRFLALIFGTLILSACLASVSILYNNWRSGYVTLFQDITPLNLLTFNIKTSVEKLIPHLFASDKKGLPIVRLYVPESAQRNLLSDLPKNIKNWHQGKMLYPDGTLKRIKARFRGDNPMNWGFEKKSWRIKTRKKKLINNVRSLNFVIPTDPSMFGNYFSYHIGQLTGVTAPKTRLVELLVNEKNYGVYLENPKLDELFLRNSHFMPVNLYKGEQYNAERRLMLDTDLFNNSGLWSKVSVFNQIAKDDYSDLTRIFDLVRQAETSKVAFDKLRLHARISDWARFDAFQVLVQSWHNTDRHNQRIVSDLWKGTISPVLHDTGIGFPRHSPPSLAKYSHSLLGLYIKSSEFMWAKYRYLHEFSKNDILLSGIEHIRTLLPALKASAARDRFRGQLVYLNKWPQDILSEAGMEKVWGELLADATRHHNWLKRELTTQPMVSWNFASGAFNLTIKGPLPVNKVTINLAEASNPPTQIVWDKDGDGKISGNDIVIPHTIQGHVIVLKAIWFSNRAISSSSARIQSLDSGEIKNIPTTFRLVFNTNVQPRSVQIANALTDEFAIASEKIVQGASPSRLNWPIIQKPALKEVQWSGTIHVKGTKVIEFPIQISAGTVIKLEPDASLIFRNKVYINGSASSPVKILPTDKKNPWGVVALQGPKTTGSRISHLNIKGGSGRRFENIHYVGMFSIHDTKDILIQGLSLSENYKFDDMMHIVYSENIVLKNCSFEGAFSDALDVDISHVEIDRCKISNSGNDAIDFMSSTALITDSKLFRSKDKGISVGENSNIAVFNSILQDNVIGIESKDSSRAIVINSDMKNNATQVNAYSKNWRYSNGGEITFERTVFSGAEIKAHADKKSRVSIIDSTISSLKKTGKGVVKVDTLSSASSGRGPVSPLFSAETTKRLKEFNILEHQSRRGILN